MGNSQPISSIWFDRSKWRQVDTIGNMGILQNNVDGSQAQEYTPFLFGLQIIGAGR
jgi:hypothetical protein